MRNKHFNMKYCSILHRQVIVGAQAILWNEVKVLLEMQRVHTKYYGLSGTTPNLTCSQKREINKKLEKVPWEARIPPAGVQS